MPGGLRARLDRLSNALQAETVADEAASSDHLRMMSMMAKIQFQYCPVLRYVEPEDTDPGTYAEIQELRARARGQWEEADQWQRVMQQHRTGDPDHPAVLTSDEILERLHSLAEMHERGEKSDRQKAAECAERRLGSDFVNGLSPNDPI